MELLNVPKTFIKRAMTHAKAVISRVWSTPAGNKRRMEEEDGEEAGKEDNSAKKAKTSTSGEKTEGMICEKAAEEVFGANEAIKNDQRLAGSGGKKGKGSESFKAKNRKGDGKGKSGKHNGKDDFEWRLKKSEIDYLTFIPGSAQLLRDTPVTAAEERVVKRKVAVLMGFAGFAYSGMQINVDQNTIEACLHMALFKAGGVSRANAFNPNKIGFSRAARTDKGVSAVGQILGLKMCFPEDEARMVQRLNEHLPPDIRVWGITRTSGGFNAKHEASSRVYEYILPTYVFLNPPTGSWDVSRLEEAIKSGRWERSDLPGVTMDEKTSYRISPESLEAFRSVLQGYEGTHNFWNFTVRQAYTDQSSNRYIMSVKCSEPFDIHSVEYVRITVHGQSFMLHQIRKMVAFAALVIRHNVPNPLDLLKTAFTETKLTVPKAPALGLFLVEVKAESYNEHMVARLRTQGLDRGELSFAPYEQEMTAFKEKFIYEEMWTRETQSNIFSDWIRALDEQPTHFMYFLNPTGRVVEEWRSSAWLKDDQDGENGDKEDEEDGQQDNE